MAICRLSGCAMFMSPDLLVFCEPALGAGRETFGGDAPTTGVSGQALPVSMPQGDGVTIDRSDKSSAANAINPAMGSVILAVSQI